MQPTKPHGDQTKSRPPPSIASGFWQIEPTERLGFHQVASSGSVKGVARNSDSRTAHLALLRSGGVVAILAGALFLVWGPRTSGRGGRAFSCRARAVPSRTAPSSQPSSPAGLLNRHPCAYEAIRFNVTATCYRGLLEHLQEALCSRTFEPC